MHHNCYHTNDISKSGFLVTGGAGFIGSHLVDYLMQYGAGRVVVLDNLFNGSEENICQHFDKTNFKFIHGDIRELETCRNAMNHIDYVMHEAAIGSVPRSLEDPVTTNVVNVDGFLNILIAAKETNIKRLIYASSSSVYGDSMEMPKREEVLGEPLSPYAVSKLANELYANVFVKNFGMEIIGLRYFNIFGPRQKTNDAYAAAIPLFIGALLKGQRPVIYGDGEQTRDFTFVSNVVQGNIKALFCRDKLAIGNVFNIAFGQTTSVNTVLLNLSTIMASREKAIYKDGRRGDVKNSHANIDKANKILGFFSNEGIEKGLQLTLEWYKAKNIGIVEKVRPKKNSL